MPGHHLVVHQRDVSKIHAELAWTGSCWIIQDKSSNGTFVDGLRIPTGRRIPLSEGASIRFASSEWQLVSAAPPSPMARRDGADELVIGQHGLLHIPDSDEPEACVFKTPMGWVIETIGEDSVHPVENESLITVNGEPWVLMLPVESLITYNNILQLEKGPLVLRFRHSQDFEHLRVGLLRGEDELIEWSSRSHHQTLFALAQIRSEDQLTGISRPGWRTRDQLAQRLQIEKNTLHQHFFRARKAFRALGSAVEDEEILESEGRQIRLGIRTILIEQL
jgi:hypothetical protein